MRNGEVRQKVTGAVYGDVYWSSHENVDRAMGAALMQVVQVAVFRAGYRAVHVIIAPHKEPLHPGLGLYLGGMT